MNESLEDANIYYEKEVCMGYDPLWLLMNQEWGVVQGIVDGVDGWQG